MLPLERRYNAGTIFKRARGKGRITHSEGLDALMARYGEHVALVDLLPVGAPRRDWRSTVTGDGMIVVRPPDRKSVVQGKSVDLGGRRIIKKKKNHSTLTILISIMRTSFHR